MTRKLKKGGSKEGSKGSKRSRSPRRRVRYEIEHEDKYTAKEGIKKSAGRYGETETLRKTSQHVLQKWRDVAKAECAPVMDGDDMTFCLYCIETLGRYGIFDYDDWTERKEKLEEENPNYFRIKECVEELVRYGVFEK